MRVHLRVGDPPREPHWRSDDYYDVPDAIDDLEHAIYDLEDEVLDLVILPTISDAAPYPLILERALAQLARLGYDGEVRAWLTGEITRSHCVRVLPLAQRPVERFALGEVALSVTVGNIRDARADAIVNASNTRMWLGGGVSGALVARFGRVLQSQMHAQADTVGHGDSIVTTHSRAETGVRAIYHVASAQGSRETVERCLHEVFRRAAERGDDHVITPALGTGTGGMSIEVFAGLLRDACLRQRRALRLELWCWSERDLRGAVNALNG